MFLHENQLGYRGSVLARSPESCAQLSVSIGIIGVQRHGLLHRRREGQQSDITRLENRIPQTALLRGTDARNAAWNDLASLGDKRPGDRDCARNFGASVR